MEKNKLIIVEGPQGTGKTTLANYLRENLASSELYRLSGIKDKTLTGKEANKIKYYALLEYLKTISKVPIDNIFDRMFFTEEIYARLGYKEFSFTDVYNDLLEELVMLDYDIYYFVLYLKQTELYRERLARESHHNYQAFSITNSVNQQNEYLQLADELTELNAQNLHIIKLPMDNFDIAYEKVNQLLKIK